MTNNKMIDGDALLEWSPYVCRNKKMIDKQIREGKKQEWDYRFIDYEMLIEKIQSLISETQVTNEESLTVDPSDWQVGDRFFVVGDYTEGVFPKIVEEVKGKKIISDLRIYFDNSDKIYTQEYFDLNYDELYNLDAERRKLQTEIDAERRKSQSEINNLKKLLDVYKELKDEADYMLSIDPDDLRFGYSKITAKLKKVEKEINNDKE